MKQPIPAVSRWVIPSIYISLFILVSCHSLITPIKYVTAAEIINDMHQNSAPGPDDDTPTQPRLLSRRQRYLKKKRFGVDHNTTTTNKGHDKEKNVLLQVNKMKKKIPKTKDAQITLRFSTTNNNEKKTSSKSDTTTTKTSPSTKKTASDQKVSTTSNKVAKATKVPKVKKQKGIGKAAKSKTAKVSKAAKDEKEGLMTKKKNGTTDNDKKDTTVSNVSQEVSNQSNKEDKGNYWNEIFNFAGMTTLHADDLIGSNQKKKKKQVSVANTNNDEDANKDSNSGKGGLSGSTEGMMTPLSSSINNGIGGDSSLQAVPGDVDIDFDDNFDDDYYDDDEHKDDDLPIRTQEYIYTASSSSNKYYPDLESGTCVNDGKEGDFQPNLFDTLDECCNFEWLNRRQCLKGPITKYYPDLVSGGCLNDGKEGKFQPNLFDTLSDCCNFQWLDRRKCLKVTRAGVYNPTASPETSWPTFLPTFMPTRDTPEPTIIPSETPTAVAQRAPPARTSYPTLDPTTVSPTLNPATTAPISDSPTTLHPSTTLPSKSPLVARSPIGGSIHEKSSDDNGGSSSDSNTLSPSIATTSSLPVCPPLYDTTKTSYVSGEFVSIQNEIFLCNLEVYCNLAEWDELFSDYASKEMWDNAWIKIGPCENENDSPSSGAKAPPAPMEPTDSPSLFPLTDIPSKEPTLQPSDHPSTSLPTQSPSNFPTEDQVLPNCPDPYSSSLASTYVAGTQVEVNSVIYQCKGYPFAYYCTQLDFEPDLDNLLNDNMLWKDAWEVVEDCRIVTNAPTSSNPTLTPSFKPTLSPSASPSIKASTLVPTSSTSTQTPSLEPTNKSTTSSPVTDPPSVKPTNKSPPTLTTKLGTLSESPTADTLYVSAALPINPATENVPDKRFTEWSKLTAGEKATAMESLGYTPLIWNRPGLYQLESWAFYELHEDEQSGAKGLGINGEMWDCHINHYHGYWWQDLQALNLDQYFIALGWNANMWDEGDSTPDTNDMYWDMLTQEQQAAATQVCFTHDLWDEIPLPEWTTASSITLTPTEEPSKSPSVPDTSLPTEQPSLPPSSLSPTSPSSPTLQPSLQPSSSSPTVLEVSLPPTINLPVNPATKTIPEKRFIQWELLDDTDRSYATDLGYTSTTWNMPGTSDLENWRFADLVDNEQAAAGGLGINEAMWDCHINHYKGYWWQELEQLQQYFVLLGWDMSMWDDGVSTPETHGMKWYELTANQRAAAKQVCFSKALWNASSLTEWTSLPTLTPSSSPTPPPPHLPSNQPTLSPITDEPTTQKPSREPTHQPTRLPGQTASPVQSVNPVATQLPKTRYTEWFLLSDDDKRKANLYLDYDPSTWNNPGEASVEDWAFHDLYETERNGIVGLGMNEDVWDCHVNHYFGFWWEDIVKFQLDKYYSVLGWDEDSWDNDKDAPHTEAMYWDELTPEQQAAAVQLCYFRDLWDSISIPDMKI